MPQLVAILSNSAWLLSIKNVAASKRPWSPSIGKLPFTPPRISSGAIIADGTPRESVRVQSGLPIFPLAGCDEKNQPAMRNLDEAGQANR
jgi:hypothetical protein